MIAQESNSHADSATQMHTKASHNGKSKEQRIADEATSLANDIANATKKQHIDSSLLADKRPEVISLACRKLPIESIVPFVNELLKITKRKEREPYVVHWIKSIMLAHATYFKGNTASHELLSQIYIEVNEQMEAWSQTLPLEGRLNLIQDQIDARLAFAAGQNESEDEEQSSEDEESEIDYEEEILDINDVEEGSAQGSGEDSNEEYYDDDDDNSVDLEKSDDEDM